MKKSLQTMIGVTLLEIMLVLAIASMVVVMSIRYYQSASTNQKISSGLNVITGILAAGESLLAATGSVQSASAATIGPYLPKSQMPASPWGGTVSVTGGQDTSYTITMPIAVDACPRFIPLVNSNAKTQASCSGSNVVIVVSM